jgi:hypothetical protein
MKVGRGDGEAKKEENTQNKGKEHTLVLSLPMN